MKNQKGDSQILELLEVIQRYAADDFSVSANLYGKSDPIDALAIGINMMGEELKASRKEQKDKTRKLVESLKKLEASSEKNLEEKEKYKSLTDNINIGIYRSKAGSGDGFLEANPAMFRMLGFKTKEEFLAEKPGNLWWDPSDRKRFLEKLQKQLDVVAEEVNLRKKDNEKIICTISAKAVKDKQGNVIFYDGVVEDVTENKLAEKALIERAKELKCLYGISEIIGQKVNNTDKSLQKIVNLLPSGWHYPEITCGHIIIDKKTYKTNNFRKTKWVQQADIIINSQIIGSVEVYYLEEKPDLFQGPFLKEERDLINSIAKQLSEYTAHQQVEKERRKSEKKFRALFDFAPDAIYMMDIKGTFIEGNMAAEKMLGFTRKELVGKNFLNLNILSKTQIARSLKLLARNARGKPTGPDEFILTRKDGRKVAAEILTYPLKIEEKTQVLGIARDITQRLEMQKTFKENEGLLNKITSSAPDAIVVIDNDGDVIFWNSSAEKIFGYNIKEIIGKSFHEIIVPDKFQEAYKKGFSKFKKTGKGSAIGATLQLEALNKKGQSLPVELSLSAIKINNKWHSVGIIRDITERKVAEEKLEEAKTDAENANLAKSDFLANMSHEIRTPMNAILGFSEILEEQLEHHPELNDYIIGIKNSGKGLLGLINDILDLSKIEAGKMEINYEPINPGAIIDEIRQIFLLKTSEKKLDFKVNVDPNLPEGLLFDETRFRQILFNLIGNAIKFTNEGGITVNVVCKDGYEEGSHIDLSLEVIDTGIGINEKSQQVIFEPFRQKDGQSTRRFGGTGLGLTITRRLVSLMKGTISLESEEKKGSTFKVFLPRIRVSALVESSGSMIEEVSGINFRNPQILLVEDIESNRKVVRGYLESCNVRIIEAENGSIGIEKAEKFRPDLILMDIQMPGINGYEATEIIKSNKDLKSIPIIALTASSLKKDVSKIENLCDGFLRKPVSKSLLLSELIRFLPVAKQEEAEGKTVRQETNFLHELKQFVSQKGRIPEEFIEIFHTRIVPEHEAILKNKSNKNIRNFASMVLKTGKEYNIKVLENYGIELEEYLDSFNVKKINALLTDFREMAKIIPKR